MTDSYPEIRDYLLREYAAGGLDVIAAKTKLPEYALRDIVTEGEVITDIYAEKIKKVMF